MFFAVFDFRPVKMLSGLNTRRSARGIAVSRFNERTNESTRIDEHVLARTSSGASLFRISILAGAKITRRRNGITSPA